MTKYKGAKVTFQVLIISFSAIAGWSGSAGAQGICIPDPVTVTAVSGKVVAQLEKGETPLSLVSITLFKDQYEEHMVAETTVDANGSFSFSHIKSGKYILTISVPNLQPFSVRVRVKPSKAKAAQKEIVVTIGADFTKPCAGSSTELRLKKDE
jgi:hypothetical protein